LAHGKKLDLEAPGVDARFQINAELPIGARLVTLDKPPAPVPPERTPATPFVRVESNDPAAPMEVVMSFRLPEAVWNSGRPALYAYDAKSGWAPLPGQLRTDRTRRVSGLDTSPRIYAVLLEPAAGGDASAGGETEQSNQGE
jgi:hypothetical protein